MPSFDPGGWKDAPTTVPASSEELEAAVRARTASTGSDREQALHDVQVIREIAEENDWTYAEAEAWYDAPENQVMCEDCGWTYGMVCPECTKGCGCEYQCTGWRHQEWNDDDDDDTDDGCPECGAGGPDSSPYDECACYE